jgi:ATP-dependent DNA helicase RecG
MSRRTRGLLYYPLGSTTPLGSGSNGLDDTSKRSFDPQRLERPVSSLKGVGRTTAARLGSLGIDTVRDLLLHLPFRHEAPSRLTCIGALCVGEEVTLRAHVVSCALRETTRRRVKVLEALISDGTGSVLATWYNQAYLEAAFKRRPELLLKGALVRNRGVPTFLVRRHEILGEDEESRHILGLIPVYPSTADLSVRTIRTALHNAAPLARELADPLPAELVARRRYPGKAEAVLSCHFPQTVGEAEAARKRLAFEELLLLQLAVLHQRAGQESQRRARALAPPGGLAGCFLESLPYQPTSAQLRAIEEIEGDLPRDVPMRRLLHGDVGSGKTMVATYSLLRGIEQGSQAALMAPTEVLADQHYFGLSQQLERLGVRVMLLKGSQAASDRRAVRAEIEAGKPAIVVGTHALIQEGVSFHDLRVVIVDEQHRFGVRQRDAILSADSEGLWPHALHMSATPIPRTLSLTLYGDLDISVLDEMPSGRRPVRTRLVFGDSEARMWELVRRELARGRQAYVVCPLIEESESLQTASARQTFDELTSGELVGFRIRLLHGQLPPAEKAAAMAAYASAQADVLVSTSVIEVGVDVPNATVMVIMGARRFGLSQLHQLRGRVGRGGSGSYCFLLAEGEEDAVLERLALFARVSDGFQLAEADMMARGEGQLFGERQSGLGDLEVASLWRDRALLEDARAEAQRLMAARALARGAGSVLAPPFEAAEARFGRKIQWMERL